MAASGYTPIQLYRTSTSGASPTSGNLNAGELAINYNTADMSVWALNTSGSVVRLMNNPAGLKYPTVDGTNGQVIKTDGSGTLSWVAQPTGTVTSVTGTAPVVSSGGTTPAISMAAATTSVNGYLTSTDWTAFNGKYSTGGALGTPSSGNLSSCTNAVGYGLKSATTTVSVSAATAPTTGQALVATSSTTATWQTPASAGLTLGTAANTSSGVSIDYTGLPAGVKQINVNFVGVSVSGTSQIVIQIGDSGGIEISGYLVLMSRLADGSTVSSTNSPDGFGCYSTSAAAILSGSIVLNLENSGSNTWVAQGAVGNTAALLAMSVTAGRKSLSAELDRVRITTSAGIDTFDAGQINISYQ